MRARPAVLAPLFVSLSLLADGPRPAADLLKEASAKAASGKKNVLVLFHASWCGWCRKLEGVLARPEVKAALTRHYESFWLTVQERGAKKSLENPGGGALYEKLGGSAETGLPLYGVFDPSGKAVATSVKGGENIGYPGTPEEIAAFVGVVRSGAPRMTDAEAETLRKAFPVLAP